MKLEEAAQMTVHEELSNILRSGPEIMGGAICFTSNRIPVVMQLDDVAAGVPMDKFYDRYPSLTPGVVVPVLRWDNHQARKAMGLELVA